MSLSIQNKKILNNQTFIKKCAFLKCEKNLKKIFLKALYILANFQLIFNLSGKASSK